MLRTTLWFKRSRDFQTNPTTLFENMLSHERKKESCKHVSYRTGTLAFPTSCTCLLICQPSMCAVVGFCEPSVRSGTRFRQTTTCARNPSQLTDTHPPKKTTRSTFPCQSVRKIGKVKITSISYWTSCTMMFTHNGSVQ